ncbi:MAG: NYN domain-containing protein [Actinomycetota bacterium]
MNDVDSALPDALLGPLLESAADTLRSLDSKDVPLSLRHLHGFDRRGLMHGPGPRQLRKSFGRENEFRTRVLEHFGARSEVQAVLARWSAGTPLDVVHEANQRRDLPLLVSALWACRPKDADFGLGIAVALEAHERQDRGDHETTRTRAREHAEIEEARRRADVARLDAETEAARATAELHQERSTRRSREERAEAEANDARRRADALQSDLDRVRNEIEAERARAAQAAQRTRTVEDALGRAKVELVEAAQRLDAAPSRLAPRDVGVLADAATSARAVASALESLRSRVETSSAPADERLLVDAPTTQRMQPRVPAGVVATSTLAVEAMLRTKGVVLVVDGYNVTKRAWPDASAADQRERLGAAATALNRRLGCEVRCVFDGDGTGPPVVRRGGVRVLFSDLGEEADEVVVREVATRPKRVPIVVASSDAWVRQHAAAEGAVVVPAESLLAVMRTTG